MNDEIEANKGERKERVKMMKSVHTQTSSSWRKQEEVVDENKDEDDWDAGLLTLLRMILFHAMIEAGW